MVVVIAGGHEFVGIVFGAAAESEVAAAVDCSPVAGLSAAGIGHCGKRLVGNWPLVGA